MENVESVWVIFEQAEDRLERERDTMMIAAINNNKESEGAAVKEWGRRVGRGGS